MSKDESTDYRSDLKGCLPVVYNGKSAEEWYALYCQLVLKYDELRKVSLAFAELPMDRNTYTLDHAKRRMVLDVLDR
jgi:hypothetical protein